MSNFEIDCMKEDNHDPESQLESIEEKPLSEKPLVSSSPFPNIVIGALSTSYFQGQPARFSLDKLANVTSDPSSWNDSIPKPLTFCQIELNSEDHIEAVLRTKDTLAWNNICMLQESYISYSNFPRFASQLGPQVQILKLDKFFGSIPEITFISCCLSLKSLTILQLDVRQSPRMLLPSEFPNLNKTFRGVKELSVEAIFFDYPKQLEFFKHFLNRFPKLDTIYIPKPHGPNQTEWEMLKSLQSKYLIKPVVDYLNERHNNMMMPMNLIRRTVNTGGVFSNTFPELALACAKNGAFLANVSQKQIQNLFLTQDTTLGKILSLNDGLNDRRLLGRWVNLDKVFLRTSVCEIRSDMANKAKGPPTFPNLKSISLTFDSDSKLDPEFQSLKRLLSLLIGCPRLSVKELLVYWPPFGHNTPPEVMEVNIVGKNLPNLQKFHASHWKAWDNDLLQLLKGLLHLHHLIVEDCAHFTEFGLLGPDPTLPVILNLKELKSLEVVNRNGSGSITDTCFERAFQHIPLKALVFDTVPNLVTKEGYNYLVKSETFRESIEIFPQPKSFSSDMNEILFKELRNQFKNFNRKAVFAPDLVNP